MSASVIGLDWGTTNLRAFRFGADGAVRETRRTGDGMARVQDRAFESTMLAAIEDWLPARVFISGMAGAREGWIEAPYAACPADSATLAAAMTRAPARSGEVWIAPGLKSERADGVVEVMRGEETQIVGALGETDAALAIAPGTHSKWARLDGGRISDIRTYMTGELFALLKTQSILARLMQGDGFDEVAFDRGARRGLADSALLNLVFSARTEGLFGHVEPEALASYLSGVLIGSEVAEGLALLKLERDAPILLIAAGELAACYRRTLAMAGAARVETLDGERAAARGLWLLAQARGAA